MRNLLAGLRLRAVEGLLVADDSNIGLIGKHCFSKETNVLGTKIMQKRAILSAHTARVDMLWLCCTPTPTVLCSSSLHGIQAFGPNGTACVSLLCGTAFQPERASELMLNRFFSRSKSAASCDPEATPCSKLFRLLLEARRTLGAELLQPSLQVEPFSILPALCDSAIYERRHWHNTSQSI